MKQFNYNLEISPPYDQDDDEGDHQQHNIKFIEKLVCDDDIDFKSQDEYSSQSMHSPPLSVSGTSGLRIPVSNMFSGHGPSYKPAKTIAGQPSGGASKGLLTQSSSCKTIRGIIIEGGSSSSEENKRPSIVQEQKTEEDAADDASTGGQNLFKESQHVLTQEKEEDN